MISVDGKTTLFIETGKVTEEVRDYLREGGVSCREYGEVWTYLRQKQWGDGKVRFITRFIELILILFFR